MHQQTPDGLKTRSPDEWSQFLENETAAILGEHHAPGVSILLVTPEGEGSFQKCWGLAEVEPAAPLKLDTPIRAGSISKIVTAIAVQQLVDSGKMSLDARIDDILDWKLPYNYGSATICDLLTHRAGIGERFARQSTPHAAEIADLSGYLRKSLPPPVAEVGATVTYSNFGISLAALAVEKLTGQTFEEYACDSIFRPLGMNGATFIPDAEIERQMAKGYNWIFGNHRKLPLRHWKPYPASSLVATPNELGLLMQVFLENETPSPILAHPQALLAEQFSPAPAVPGMGLSFWLDEVHGQRVAWHTGHMPGHRSGFYLFPDTGFGIILFYNTDKKVLRPFLDNVCSFAFAESWSKPPPKPPKNSLEPFQGTYRHSWYPHHHFGKSSAMLGKEGEELTVKIEVDNSENRLVVAGERFAPLDEDTFTGEQRQTRIGFTRNERGRVTGLYSGGRDRYEKISALETRKAHYVYIVTCLTLFVAGALFFGFNLFGGNPVFPPAASWSFLLMCAVNLGFCGAITALTSLGAYKVTEDVPLPVGITLGLPFIAAGFWLLAIGQLIFQVSSIADISIAGATAIVLFSAAELLFLWFLNYWRLLGWRYK